MYIDIKDCWIVLDQSDHARVQITRTAAGTALVVWRLKVYHNGTGEISGSYVDMSSRGRQLNVKNSDPEAYSASIRNEPEASPATTIGITWPRHFSFSSEVGEEECAALLSTGGFIEVIGILKGKER